MPLPNRQLILIAAVSVFLWNARGSWTQERVAHGQLVVKLRQARGARQLTDFARSRALKTIKAGRIPGTILIDAGPQAAKRKADLQADPMVEYVDHNRLIPIATTIPNDSLFGSQYHL